jgi:hypothetical protein
LFGMGGERSSTTRMRLAGKICCFCGRYLDARRPVAQQVLGYS